MRFISLFLSFFIILSALEETGKIKNNETNATGKNDDLIVVNSQSDSNEGFSISYSYEVKYVHLPLSSMKYISLKYVPAPAAYDLMLDYGRKYLLVKSLKNPAEKYVDVLIDKSHQRMYVYVDDIHLYKWKISTARRGYWTPTGNYRPYTLHRMHYSRKYHNSPMPWSVFFKGGFAIHGTDALRHLGRPASHGCVRLHPKNAKILYKLIRRFGMRNTLIKIRG